MNSKKMDPFNVRMLAIRYFVEAAQSSSFAEAAERLGDKPDNVRRGVREVEKWLGYKLVIWHGELSLTSAGKDLFPKMRAICSICREIYHPPMTKEAFDALMAYSDEMYLNSARKKLQELGELK